jgi:hypothetical protein
LYREALEHLRNQDSKNNMEDGSDHSNRINQLGGESWQEMVPKTVIRIILDNWNIVEKFAQ